MTTSVADNDVESNQGGENFSSYPDGPTANPSLLRTNNAEVLSVAANEAKTDTATKVPSSLKSPSRGRGTGFGKQEILFLAKAYIRASSDPVVGTSRSHETFYQKVCDIYNQLIAVWNEENDNGKNSPPLTFRTKYSLRSHFRRCLRPAVQKLARIESRHEIQSGENEEKHLGRLFATQMKNCREGVPKEYEKYLDAYIWLKGEPKFGTHVLNPPGGTVSEDISVSGDVSASELDSDCTFSNNNKKRRMIGRDKAKKIKNDESKRVESVAALTTSVTAGGHLELFEQNLRRLNNYSELYLKQLLKGMDKFVEVEAMKHAPENDRKDYFRMVSEHALVMQRNRLLESQIKQRELMKRMAAISDNNKNGSNREDKNQK